jgi:hypothetical protein
MRDLDGRTTRYLFRAHAVGELGNKYRDQYGTYLPIVATDLLQAVSVGALAAIAATSGAQTRTKSPYFRRVIALICQSMRG